MKQQFDLKNAELSMVYNAVYDIPVVNSKTNRGKFKLLTLIKKKVDEYQDDLDKILQKYALKDAEGNFLPGQNGKKYKIPEDTKEADEELKELQKETVTIVYGEYSNRIKDIVDFLDSYEGQLDGKTGEGIYTLLEAIEEGK